MGTVTYLLDTHALLWWWFVAPELSVRARALIADPQHQILVSAASIWEITTKFRNGKLAVVIPIIADLAGAVRQAGFGELPVTLAHANRAGLMPGEIVIHAIG